MFDPGSTSGGVVSFIEDHPLGIALAVGGLVLLFVLMGSGSSAPVATGSTDDSSTQAAAAITGAQIAGNTSTALATIAAGVTNNQTAAAQTVALATLQGQNDATAAAATATLGSAYYGAASHISDNNTAAFIANTQATATEQVAGDQATAAEFGNLASVLTAFGANSTSILNGLVKAGMPTAANGSGVTLTGVAPNITPLSLAGSGNAYGAYATIVQHDVDAGLAVASANQQNETNTAAAVNINAANNAARASSLASLTTTVNGGLKTFGTWLSQFTGAFNTAVASNAPKTTQTTIGDLNTANAGLLGNAPNFGSNFSPFVSAH